ALEIDALVGGVAFLGGARGLEKKRWGFVQRDGQLLRSNRHRNSHSQAPPKARSATGARQAMPGSWKGGRTSHQVCSMPPSSSRMATLRTSRGRRLAGPQTSVSSGTKVSDDD